MQYSLISENTTERKFSNACDIFCVASSTKPNCAMHPGKNVSLPHAYYILNVLNILYMIYINNYVELFTVKSPVQLRMHTFLYAPCHMK